MASKHRWGKSKLIEEKLEDEVEITAEEKARYDEIEGETRIPFNPTKKALDLGKQKVTDIQQNSRINLPKPLPILEEAKLAIRVDKFRQITNQFMKETWNQKKVYPVFKWHKEPEDRIKVTPEKTK